jgi:hypothetical protein
MKTGGHIKPCKVGDVEKHNSRDPEYVERMKSSTHPLNFYPTLALRPNYDWKNTEREEYRDKSTRKPLTVAQVFNNMIEVYKQHDKRHRRPPLKDRERWNAKEGKMETIAGWSPIREAVIVIKPDTKPEDFDKVLKFFKDRGVEPMFLDLHFDEGHLDENGNLKANNHAHLGLDFFDWNTGKTIKLGKKTMSELQTVLADALGMERGELKEVSGRDYMDIPEYREYAKAVEEKKQELQQLTTDVDGLSEKKAKLEQENAGLQVTNTLGGAAVAIGQSVAGVFNQSKKDKTIKQLQDTIAGEPQRIEAAKADERNQTIRDICKAARYKPNDQTAESIGKSWRKGWDKVDSLKEAIDIKDKAISTQNNKILEQEREIKRLNNKISLMDQVKNKLAEVVDYAIKFIKKGTHFLWMRDSFNEYCDMTNANDQELRHINAQRVAIECIHALDSSQLRKLDGELDAIVKNPSIGQGLKQG